MADSALRLFTLSLLASASSPAPSAPPVPKSSDRQAQASSDFNTQSATPLLRRTSLGSTSSTSSTDSQDSVELRDWIYRTGERDEVKRKRRENRKRREKEAEKAWREFWG
ncbi:hypothetical protein BDZ45DRAFT_113550 [Acephala macrosclerotiorum]|nr:hypothetical protein BDZ45DRAFT_113550 [Acephala macrosclerotiorum]